VITKEELKREVDKIPENLLEEAYSLLKRVIGARKKPEEVESHWNKWAENLKDFSQDFMVHRDQTIIQSRESFD
jgi:hypothetical protein